MAREIPQEKYELAAPPSNHIREAQTGVGSKWLSCLPDLRAEASLFCCFVLPHLKTS